MYEKELASMNATRRSLVLTLLLAFALSLLVLPAQIEAQTAPREQCFEETGYCVQDPILAYWETNGGLPVFGFPITEQSVETVEGRTLQVQWFERDRLEIQEDGTITAGRLGVQLLELNGQPWQEFPTTTEAETPAGCAFFGETNHSVCEPFLSYWQNNGGLERFGFPVTEPFEATIDGWTGTIQYFERRRMEHHTENEPPFNVLLGLLGNEVLNADGTGGGGSVLDTSGQIAFTSSRTGNKEIWVMDGAGANATQVTDNPDADDFQPSWSPDGSQITYVVGTEATQNQDIWVIDADGSNARQLSESSAAEWEPAWSPDGSQIAFVSDREGDADIFIRNADGSGEDFNLTAYAPASAQYSPAWSPDGTRIAYISTENGSPSLWVMTVDGSERVELLTLNGINYPNWTPDSARILFDTGFNIGIINSDGQNFQSLYNYDGTHPTVSPNGSTIAYESEENDILITDLGREDQRNLTNTPGSVDQDPDWR
jgi:hypothetical protein